MGKVAITLRILPESLEVDLKGLIREINKSIELVNTSEEEIAFGLKAINATVFVDDKEGGSEEVEKKIKSVKGTGEIQVLDMHRV